VVYEDVWNLDRLPFFIILFRPTHLLEPFWSAAMLSQPNAHTSRSLQTLMHVKTLRTNMKNKLLERLLQRPNHNGAKIIIRDPHAKQVCWCPLVWPVKVLLHATRIVGTVYASSCYTLLHISLVSEDFGLLQLCCGAVSDTSRIPPVSFGWIRIAAWKTHLESRTVQYRSQAWRACHRWRGHHRWDSLKRSQVSLKGLESVSAVSL